MATIGEDWSKTAAEAAQAAQEAARRYMDESTAFGRSYLRSMTSIAHAGLGVAFLQQNAMIQVARTVAEANAQASRDWLNQATDTLRMAQDATSKLVTASSDLVDSMVATPRS